MNALILSRVRTRTAIFATTAGLVLGSSTAALAVARDSGENTRLVAAGHHSGRAPGVVTPRAGKKAVMRLRDNEFPRRLRVKPGQKIKVRNLDGMAHTVTSSLGGFDKYVAAHGKTSFRAPLQRGKYQLVCLFHPGMRGKLIVG